MACQKSFLNVCKLRKTNAKQKKAQSLSMFQFSPLYTSLPHKLLLKCFQKLSILCSKLKLKKCIGFLKVPIWWNSNEDERGYFTKQSLPMLCFSSSINPSSLLVKLFKKMVYQQVFVIFLSWKFRYFSIYFQF